VPEDFGSQRFRIDKDGRWYHDGVAIERVELVRMLAPHVRQEPDGEFMLHWGPTVQPISVADTPAVIRSVCAPDAQSGTCEVTLVDGRTVSIGLADIRTGTDNTLYARMPDGADVRFGRNAYYQFAAHIEAADDGFVVVAGRRRWPIGCRS